VTQEIAVVLVLVVAAAFGAGMIWPEQCHQPPDFIADSVAHDPGQPARSTIHDLEVTRRERVVAGALAGGQPDEAGAGASSVATAALLCCTAFALSRLLWSLGSRQQVEPDQPHDLVAADRFSDWR
jgi:hypothetical protein